MIRVALYGNVANNFVQLARALRRESDLDVHLYVDVDADLQYRPESDDPELAGDVPWIHRGRWTTPVSVAMPWRAPLVAQLREADVVVVSDTGPVFAQFAGRPYTFFVTGADLTMRPFPLRFFTWRQGWERRVAAFPIAAWQRRGLRHATQWWSQPFLPFVRAQRRLRIPAARLAPGYFPIPFDPERFVAGAEQAGPEAQRIGAELRASSDFLVFHPSRLVVHDDARLRDTGQWKANDVLVRGFAEYLRTARAERPLLVLPESTMSRDVMAVRALIDELGIGHAVRWVKPPRAAGFTRFEMASLYRDVDVVADDFGAGWFGAVALEGFACEKPVVSHVDETVMAQLYPWHPISEAADEHAAAGRLSELEKDPAKRARLGRRGAKWVAEFHAPDAVAPRYASGLRDLAAR